MSIFIGLILLIVIADSITNICKLMLGDTGIDTNKINSNSFCSHKSHEFNSENLIKLFEKLLEELPRGECLDKYGDSIPTKTMEVFTAKYLSRYWKSGDLRVYNTISPNLDSDIFNYFKENYTPEDIKHFILYEKDAKKVNKLGFKQLYVPKVAQMLNSEILECLLWGDYSNLEKKVKILVNYINSGNRFATDPMQKTLVRIQGICS